LIRAGKTYTPSFILTYGILFVTVVNGSHNFRKRRNIMFKKIVIFIVFLLPVMGAAARSLSVLQLLTIGSLAALAVSLVVMQGKPQQ
jgi:hypothetical protein